jgi:hypothetical protein
MTDIVTDDDIRRFLQRNKSEYPSQIMLMQRAVELLWPSGPPTGASQRVVRLCLDEFSRPSGGIVQSPTSSHNTS